MEMDARHASNSAANTATTSSWPAERHPTSWDVDDANQVPPVTVIDRFRSALIHGESESVVQSAASWDLESSLDAPGVEVDLQPYTYPMVLLSGLQTLPSEDDLAMLRRSYIETFGSHVYINEITTEGVLAQTNPPYLQLALACIASIFSPHAMTMQEAPHKVSEHLFFAGFHVWGVILEVDNREARNAKAVIAAALLSTYGILASGSVVKRKTAGLLCNVTTITRRLRLTDDSLSAYTSLSVSDRDLAGKSALLCYMLLIDILHGLQSNTTPNYSINELSFRMPQTEHKFQTVYSALFHDHAIPPDLDHRDDALALLIALLSNVAQMHKTYFAPFRNLIPSDPWNPYRPLTWRSELSGAVAAFNTALARWEAQFLHRADHDVLALHYFTKLCLVVPDIAELPALARDDAGARKLPGGKPNKVSISHEALELSWEVFEQAECAIKMENQRMSIWLPEIVFLSALVVWQSHLSAISRRRHGSLRSLNMHQTLLLQLSWPCCAEMAAVLDLVAQQR